MVIYCSSFYNIGNWSHPIRQGFKGFLEKHSSSFAGSVDGEEKSFVTLRPVANVIKLFKAVSYDFS